MNYPVEGILANQFDSMHQVARKNFKVENDFQKKAEEYLKKANNDAFKIDNCDEI